MQHLKKLDDQILNIIVKDNFCCFEIVNKILSDESYNKTDSFFIQLQVFIIIITN